MSIAVRGAAKAGTSLTGGNVTLTFDTGGTAPQIGDVCVVWGGHPHAAASPLGPSTAGYTPFATYTAAAPNFGAWYKCWTSTPDLTVVCQGHGVSTGGVAYGCVVLSGVDPAILDQTVAVAGPTTGTNPDPPAVTTTTANAWVIICAGSAINDAARGTVTNYTLVGGASANASGTDFSTEGGYRLIASPGSENPAAWNAWVSGANYRITIALRAARQGALAATEAPDNAALAGAVTWPVISGALSASEADDTASLAGSVAWLGDLAITEGSDAASLAGSVSWPVIQGILAPTEAQDSASLAGSVTWQPAVGTLEASEAQDSASLGGLVLVSGTLAATEQGQDVAALSGLVLIAGSMAAQEALDVASMAGMAGGEVAGSLMAGEASDTLSALGLVLVAGEMDATEGYDLATWGGLVTDPPTMEGVITLRVPREPRVYLVRETPAHSRMRDARTYLTPAAVRRYKAQGQRGGDNA